MMIILKWLFSYRGVWFVLGSVLLVLVVGDLVVSRRFDYGTAGPALVFIRTPGLLMPIPG